MGPKTRFYLLTRPPLWPKPGSALSFLHDEAGLFGWLLNGFRFINSAAETHIPDSYLQDYGT